MLTAGVMNGDGLRNTAIDARDIKNSSKSKFSSPSSSSLSSSSYVCDTANSSFAWRMAKINMHVTTLTIQAQRGVGFVTGVGKLTSSTVIAVFSVPMSSRNNRNSTRLMSTFENLGGAIICLPCEPANTRQSLGIAHLILRCIKVKYCSQSVYILVHDLACFPDLHEMSR